MSKIISTNINLSGQYFLQRADKYAKFHRAIYM